MNRSMLIAAVLSLGPAFCRAQPCEPHWEFPGAPSSPTIINRMLVFDDGSGPALYVTGGFYDVETVWRRHAGVWEPVGAGQLAGYGSDLMVLDDGSGPILYSLGYAGITPQWWFKRWTGSAWADPPPGLWRQSTPEQPESLRPVFSGSDANGPAIFGIRGLATAPSQRFVARWTGAGWQSLGGSFDCCSPEAFAMFDFGFGSQLHVTGPFSTIGGITAWQLARWDGSMWWPLGTSVGFHPDLPLDLYVYDDGSGPALYLGCGKGNPINLFDECIVRWDGQQWSSVGGGVSGPSNSPVQVRTICGFDDGYGMALYAAGIFTHAGGVPASCIAKFDGEQWRPLGPGMTPRAYDSAVFDDGSGPALFIGGTGFTIGGSQPLYVAKWASCPACYPNCDDSTAAPILNVQDFTCFLQRYAAGETYANCDQSTAPPVLNVQDFTCFLLRYAAGCP